MANSEPPEDIYHLDNRIESAYRRLDEDEDITERNKELIREFIRDIKLQNLSKSRQLFYLLRFINLGRACDKDFEDMEKDDIKDLVAWIQEQDNWAERTQIDHQTSIKRFYKWLEGGEKQYPEKVAWINTHYKNDNKKKPEDMINEKELRKLLRAAWNVRDKAMLWILWEGGLRIGELLGMRYKDVKMKEHGAELHVDGKTGFRRILVVKSKMALSRWMEDHPLQEPDSALWLSREGGALKYSSAKRNLDKIVEKSGIQRNIHFHLFRHSAATRLAAKLTEQQLKVYMGWTASSKMAATYVHLSGKDIDNAILQANGEEPMNEEEDKHSPIVCEVCDTNNDPLKGEWCTRCGHPLTTRTKHEQRNKEKLLLETLQPENVEEMIQAKVEEMLEEVSTN